jgi:predicted PurR-regulated permease PerM
MPSTTPTPQHDDAWLTRERILLFVLAFVTIAVCVLGFQLVEPFIPAITWAMVLAVMASPMHEALVRRLRRPWLAASIAVVVVTIVVALPAAFVVRQVAAEALDSAAEMRALFDGDRWRTTLDRFPRLAPLRDWVEDQVDLRAEFRHASDTVVKAIAASSHARPSSFSERSSRCSCCSMRCATSVGCWRRCADSCRWPRRRPTR